MRVSIGQIAREAGVDKSTVSRILTGKADAARISQPRIAHVRRVAHTLGYWPNLAARTVSTGRFFNVLMVHGTRAHTSGLSWEILTAEHDGLATAGYHLTYARVPDELLTDPKYVPHCLQHWMCDGLLINYIAGVPDRMVELIRTHGLPSVWINTKSEVDCVRPDDLEAGATVARKLLAQGHRRIAYIDRSFHRAVAEGVQHYSKRDRLAGCRQEVEQAGGRLESWIDGWMPGAERPFVRAQLARQDHPTAIVAYSQAEALACQMAALGVGLTVPADLSLVTFGMPASTPMDELHMSMAVQPDIRVGAEAVRMLLAKVQRPAIPQPAVSVPFAWEEGQTLAPPPSHGKPHGKRTVRPASGTS